MFCPYCGLELGDADACARCGSLRGSTPATGWRPDPTARHEGRYYAADRPTDRVRDGRKEASDADGGKMLPQYVALPRSKRTGTRSTWMGTGVGATILVLLALVTWALLRHGPIPEPPEAHYLAALKDAGLAEQFNSDANAVAHGRQVCRQLDDGEPQQGLPADQLAVDAFCPQFSKGFHVLETATVSGTFVLNDSGSDEYSRSIGSDGTSCEGTDGYSNVGSGTQVIVRNGKNEILTTTTLGQGKGDRSTCTFAFTFPVTEGQERYVVSVGHRGDFSYSFVQLRSEGVRIHLGH